VYNVDVGGYQILMSDKLIYLVAHAYEDNVAQYEISSGERLSQSIANYGTLGRNKILQSERFPGAY
jgi:hypothetical protein